MPPVGDNPYPETTSSCIRILGMLSKEHVTSFPEPYTANTLLGLKTALIGRAR